MTENPLVLCCSGHDPTGGAGIQADIEACAANSTRALTLVTALTVQDSSNVQAVQAVSAALLEQAAALLLADAHPTAMKLGLIASVEQLEVLAQIARKLACPLVMDPILRAGGGMSLATAELMAGFQRSLFPLVDLLTPNAAEARALTGRQMLADAARALLDLGVGQVLITGGDEQTEAVSNCFAVQGGGSPRLFHWPRLPGGFHGAGCTLAAAIAAHLARGFSMEDAVMNGQTYTQFALSRAETVGRGRRLPRRL